MLTKQTKTAKDYDLLIVGGGLVGASLALCLAEQGLRIALVEARSYQGEQPPSYDDRAIALSFGSRRIFEGMGIWAGLADRVSPIHSIHVSDQGHFGFTRMRASQEGVDALGYVITARELGQGLLTRLQDQAAQGLLELINPATLSDLRLEQDRALAEISTADGARVVTARLVVAADGGDSEIRHRIDIDTDEQDYQQTAIIANLTPFQPHHNQAFERFTRHGPLAILPLTSEAEQARVALVWTQSPAQAEVSLALSDEDFLAAMQAAFGHRLGRFLKVGQRHAYPLRLVRAREQVRPRLALIGNAAHTLHPIAGQGFNLGLRDVATLAQTIMDAKRQDQDIGSLDRLEAYACWRSGDQREVIGFTNLLVQGFSNDFPLLTLARNLGLLATDMIPPLKHTLARHAMGLAGKLPRLARGLPL